MFVFFNNFKKYILLIFTFILLASFTFAEPSVAVFKLSAKNINKQTNIAINNAIFTFIKELKNYKVVDMRNNPLNDKTVFGKYDYVFSGRILGVKKGIKLELVLKNSSDEITRSINKVYRNSNLILLDSRVLVSDLFNNSSTNLNTAYKLVQDSMNEDINNDDLLPVTDLSVLSGSWKGEKGVERIEIMRGGRAIAMLSSGVSIFLTMKLDNGYLNIKQSSAPLAKQFVNLPDLIAKKASNMGKTPSWKFKISKDNKILSGMKTDIEIKHNEQDIISMKKVQIPVTWHKD